MRRRALVVLASLGLAIAAVSLPTSAAADTEGSIVVAVDIAPRAAAPVGDLVSAGVDPTMALLVAAALGLSGVVAVVLARRRSATL